MTEGISEIRLQDFKKKMQIPYVYLIFKLQITTDMYLNQDRWS